MTLLRRVGCLAALVSFLAGAATPFVAVHAANDPDLAYAGVEVLGAHVERRVGPVKPAVAPEHCALCHWLQALGTARLEAAVHRISVTPSVQFVRIPQAAPIHASGFRPRASRAPPSVPATL
ncbi:MAG: hypothetical protein R2752_10910 [Vicinamibacterales bacterium]